MDGEPVATRALIRPARGEEGPVLSALALRAKAHRGYDEAFLPACRDDLRVTPEAIAARTLRVATLADRPWGLYQLRGAGEAAELSDLWIEPGASGEGMVGRCGRTPSPRHARGCREPLIQNDPHAEGCYRAMGAERIGTKPSTVFPGRDLPLLRLDFAKING